MPLIIVFFSYFASFEANAGVVVLAATNAANDLDKALVRPGRFDMSIEVNKFLLCFYAV